MYISVLFTMVLTSFDVHYSAFWTQYMLKMLELHSVHQAAWPTQPSGIVQPFQIPNYLNMVSSE